MENPNKKKSDFGQVVTGNYRTAGPVLMLTSDSAAAYYLTIHRGYYFDGFMVQGAIRRIEKNERSLA